MFVFNRWLIGKSIQAVIPTGAPQEILLTGRTLWRGVEGSRRAIPDHAATGSSLEWIVPVTVPFYGMPGSLAVDRNRTTKVFLLRLAWRHKQSGENTLNRHGEGHSLGIPPLRARGSFQG